MSHDFVRGQSVAETGGASKNAAVRLRETGGRCYLQSAGFIDTQLQ